MTSLSAIRARARPVALFVSGPRPEPRNVFADRVSIEANPRSGTGSQADRPELTGVGVEPVSRKAELDGNLPDCEQARSLTREHSFLAEDFHNASSDGVDKGWIGRL
jgi:hypothetical protein